MTIPPEQSAAANRGRDEIDFITGRRSGPTEGGVHLPDPAATLRSWFDGFVGSEEERGMADVLLSVVEAAYTLKHTGKAKPLHDALYWLEAELNA